MHMTPWSASCSEHGLFPSKLTAFSREFCVSLFSGRIPPQRCPTEKTLSVQKFDYCVLPPRPLSSLFYLLFTPSSLPPFLPSSPYLFLPSSPFPSPLISILPLSITFSSLSFAPYSQTLPSNPSFSVSPAPALFFSLHYSILSPFSSRSLLPSPLPPLIPTSFFSFYLFPPRPLSSPSPPSL